MRLEKPAVLLVWWLQMDADLEKLLSKLFKVRKRKFGYLLSTDLGGHEARKCES